MHKKILMVFGVIALTGCTAVNVKPVDKSLKLTHICIEENPKVIVAGFTSILENGFEKHLISTELYTGALPENCDFHLEYTALRSWDFAPYLTYAELKLYKGANRVGYAEYHLRGKGGFSLLKWQGAKTKMEPVIDQLLSQYN